MQVETELLRSEPLSKRLGYSVWLKMENQQISGSFKYRGISRVCKEAVEKGCKKLVCSSGGNAGLAAAFAAQVLGIPITVYVPESTSEIVREKLKEHGAKVEVYGKIWDVANAKALEAATESGVQFIHPFDDPIIWEGHATIITDIKDQLRGNVPDVIVASVGGGGLMNGILHGLHEVGWNHVPLVAMETIGADSLNACVKAGDWVEIDDITSVAKCLGARRVCKRTYQWLSEHNVISCAIPDEEALKACVKISDDHNILVPPSCGAAIAAVYSDILSDLIKEGKLPQILNNVVIIVCGGSGTTTEKVEEWRKTLRTI